MAEKSLILRILADTKGLESAFAKITPEMNNLAKAGKSVGLTLSSSFELTVKELEVLRDHLIATKAPAADLEKVTLKLTEAQLKFKDSLKTDAIKAQESALESLRQKQTDYGSSLADTGKVIQDNRAGFQSLGGTLTAIGASITGALGLSAKASIDFESAFAGVRKTVNATEPELLKMREQFLKMSTEIPTSAAELSKLGQVAGQLGIRKENIVGFARVIADLGIASNLAGEEGATMLAQFGNIVKLPQDQYSNLGSAIVALGNNSATTEKDIAEMALRLAGAGSQAGLSAPQILGLSASLASVGVEAEAGGTAFSQLLIKMQKATKEGGDSLKQFAQVSGVTSAQFKKSFEQDAAGALVSFLKGVNALNKSGANTFGILESMGIEGIRLTDSITRAANANDLFDSSIRRGTKAFQENTALAKEAGERYKTVESQFKILGNSVLELAVRIGDAVLPALRSFVDIAKPIITTLAQWAKDNPTLTATLIGVGGALGIVAGTLGPILFVLPSIIDGFIAIKAAMWAAGPAVTGFVGSLGGLANLAGYTGLIIAATAAIGGIIYAFMSWRDAVEGWRNANQGLDNVAHKLNDQLKLVGKEVERGKLSWEEWTQKVQQAAKENSGLINKLGDQERALKKTTPVTLNAAQAAAALAAKNSAAAEAAKKAAKEIEGWGSALGVTIPKLKQTVAEGEKYVAYLKKTKPASAELREAEIKLNDAREELAKGTKLATSETERFLVATKDLDKAQISNSATARAAEQQALELAQRLHSLGIVAGNELPAEFGKPTTSLLNLTDAFKKLGIVTDQTLREQAATAAQTYEEISNSGQASAREIALAWAAMTEAQVAAGAQVDAATLRTVENIKAKYGSLKDNKDANLTTWRELASKQVSTLVSDVSKGFADILVSGGSFGSKIIGMFKNIGKGMLQAFFESGIGGLLSGKGFSGFGGFATGLIDSFKGLFSGKGGLPQLAGIGGLGGFGSATTPPFFPSSGNYPLGGIAGPGAPAYPGGPPVGASAGMGTGMAALSGIGAGFGTGSGLAAALGAGPKGSIFSGIAGAAGGGIAALLGAGAMAGPWGMAIGAAAAGVAALIGKFTRRGKEKETATDAAEELSRVVWQEIVPSAQKGVISADQAEQSIKDLWTQYEQFLKSNLKDQTVIQRSIDGQKLTLTDGLKAIEDLKSKEAETSKARAELDVLIKQFTETGAITGALSEKIEELGGNLGPFREALKIPELDATRSQFAALRDELIKLKPPAEDVTASFVQTGQMTDALKAKIEEFGGSAEVFTQFTGIKTMRDDFQSLSASILSTGQGLDQVRPIFEQMGVSVAALDAAAALPGLQGLRGEFGSLLEQINQLLPATMSWQEQFLKTGVITDEMRKKIAEAGGDLEIFNKAAGEIAAGGLSAGTASIVSTELGKMTKGLDEQISDLQKGLTEALDDVGTKLDKQFEDSRTALIAQLDLMDGNLSTSIGNLQTALQTEVSNLTAAISAIKIPDQITVNVDQPASPVVTQQPESTPTIPQQSPYYNPYNYQQSYDPMAWMRQYGQYGGAFAEGGQGIIDKPTWFLAGEKGPEHFQFTPTHRMEEPALIPRAILQRLNAGMPQAMQQPKTEVNTSTVDNSKVVHMPINIQAPLPDPFAFQKQMDLTMMQLVSRLS